MKTRSNWRQFLIPKQEMSCSPIGLSQHKSLCWLNTPQKLVIRRNHWAPPYSLLTPSSFKFLNLFMNNLQIFCYLSKNWIFLKISALSQLCMGWGSLRDSATLSAFDLEMFQVKLWVHHILYHFLYENAQTNIRINLLLILTFW